MNHHKIAKKLIGTIFPVGESNTDKQIFENLKEMCHLAEMILMDIYVMVQSSKDDQQASVKKCVDYGRNFFDTTAKELIPLTPPDQASAVRLGEDLDAAVDKEIVKMINENPAKMSMFLLLQLGRQCVAANVETMTLSQESDIDGQRYETKCVVTVIPTT